MFPKDIILDPISSQDELLSEVFNILLSRTFERALRILRFLGLRRLKTKVVREIYIYIYMYIYSPISNGTPNYFC